MVECFCPVCLQSNGQGSGNKSCFAQALAFLGTGPLGRERWGRESLSISGLWCRDLPPAHCRPLTLPCPPSFLSIPPCITEQQLPAPSTHRGAFPPHPVMLQLPVPVVTEAGTEQGAPPQPWLLLLPTGVVCDLILLFERPLLTCSMVWQCFRLCMCKWKTDYKILWTTSKAQAQLFDPWQTVDRLYSFIPSQEEKHQDSRNTVVSQRRVLAKQTEICSTDRNRTKCTELVKVDRYWIITITGVLFAALFISFRLKK